jgi:hypothetical protein
VVPGDGEEVWGKYIWTRRVGKDRGSKDMDRYPLTLPPLQKRSVMMHEDRQEVARSALVKGIESKMAALIWHAVLGCLWWNCAIFGFACICECTSLIVTLVITFPLDQVLQAVVAHAAVQCLLNLILFLTIDKSWGWVAQVISQG